MLKMTNSLNKVPHKDRFYLKLNPFQNIKFWIYGWVKKANNKIDVYFEYSSKYSSLSEYFKI